MVFNISPVPECDGGKDIDSYLVSPPESFNLDYQLTHPSQTSILKRLVDIVGAIVGLIITAAIAIPIAVVTLIDNPGPIFYSQIRCGHNGKAFRIWKFRSMIKDADKLKHLVKNEANGH
ncbi:MAG: sugar transferase, partial [Cyanobacteria bacterium P01_A01_bin.80]